MRREKGKLKRDGLRWLKQEILTRSLKIHWQRKQNRQHNEAFQYLQEVFPAGLISSKTIMLLTRLIASKLYFTEGRTMVKFYIRQQQPVHETSDIHTT